MNQIKRKQKTQILSKQFYYLMGLILFFHLTFSLINLIELFSPNYLKLNRTKFAIFSILFFQNILFSLALCSVLKFIYSKSSPIPKQYIEKMESKIEVAMDVEKEYLKKIKKEIFERMVQNHFNQYLINEPEEEQLDQISFSNVLDSKTIRFCQKCDDFKPNRVYHCKECQKCIIKKDHHNFIFGKCVDIFNFKYYFLTLFYTNLYLFYIIFFSFKPFYVIFPNDDMNIALFSVFLLSFLGQSIMLLIFFVIWCFQVFVIYHGKTSFEYIYKKTFFINKRQAKKVNFLERLLWFIPMKALNKVDLDFLDFEKEKEEEINLETKKKM